MSIPVTNVPIAEYPYYYRCDHCTGAAFFLKRKPLPTDVRSSNDAIHTSGEKVNPAAPVKCDVCGKHLEFSSTENILERPDPLGVKDEAG